MTPISPLNNDSHPAVRPGAGAAGAPFRARGRLPEDSVRIADAESHDLSESEVGQKWMLIAGIVLVLFGLGYFLKYSFDQNWIGPPARIMIAYAVGLFTAMTGAWLASDRWKTFGLFVIGGGAGMLYFATYAAFGFYGFLGQPAAFALMAGITAAVVWIAIRFNAPWLAILAQFGGFLTPVMLSTGVDNQMALMSYMTILNVGLLTIACFKQWSALNFLGFLCTWTLFLGWLGFHYTAQKLLPTVAFLSVFFLTYALIPYLYFFLRPASDLKGFWITIPNMLLAVGSTVAVFAWAGATQGAGWMCLSYALVFAGLALHLSRRPGDRSLPVTMLWLQSLALAATGLSLALEGGWLTLSLAGLGLATLYGALRQRQAALHTAAALLMIAATLKLAWYDYPVHFQYSLIRGGYLGGFEAGLLPRWMTIAGVIAATYICGQMIYRTRDRHYPELQPIGRVVGVIAVFELFAALNLEVIAGLAAAGTQAQFAGVSLLWTLFGTVLMAAGFRARSKALRMAAMVLFACTLIKLFVVDTSHVATPYRILSFAAVGLLLIGASFLYHRFADRLLPATMTGAGDAGGAGEEPEALGEQSGWDQATGADAFADSAAQIGGAADQA